MKKVAMIVYMMVMAALISACTVNADANADVTYPILNEVSNEDEEPYRFEIEEVVEQLDEPKVETREASSVVSGGASWIFAKTQEGSRGTVTKRFEKLYNRNGDLLSRIEIPDAKTVDATKPTLYEGGQRAQAGAFYDASRITRYGVDCVGCNMSSDGKGGTSAGIALGLDSVRQRNGEWKKGITYEGYYIIATSATIPLCTTVEISNHTVSGMGITPGVPFKAIVLDRGGAIQGSKIDLFVGRETNMPVTQGRRQDAKVKILGLNSRTKTNGKWACGV
ncbi:3D domain-containing protein [Erysipelothrix urinaevulpis]|uniref:3D domain-containing protein n=1 Tax=Erysipelothrix urinaevulpis TaxID=2683717 RepID=UPI00135A7B6B|nr:3D domain-containing protein [Erysipelothrix urinaevulpis]